MFRRSFCGVISLVLAAGLLVACGVPTPPATRQPSEPAASPWPTAPSLSTRVYAPQPEANFALYFSYGGCLGENLNTFEGTYTRSMCPPDPPVTISLTLSAKEMQTIYHGMAKIDFFGYPDQFAVVVPPGATVGRTTGGTFYHLRVRNGDMEKELYWTDDIFEPTTKEAEQLRVFLKEIIDIINQHPEIRLVPTPSCGCI